MATLFSAFSALSHSQQWLHIFDWTTEDGAIAALDDGSLNKIRVPDHKRNDLSISELVLAQTELPINWFARAEQIARRHLHFAQQLVELFLAQGCSVVIDFFK